MREKSHQSEQNKDTQPETSKLQQQQQQPQ